MDNEILNQLKELFKTELEPIKETIKDIQAEQKKTNERLTSLEDGQKRIEKKIDTIYDQTADLTEFRTETKQGIENIQKDINKLTNVTKTNCFDIADLKAVK